MKSKIALPALLILLLATGACIHSGQNDIRGEWSFKSDAEELFVFLFIGALEKGNLVEVDYPADGAGKYSVIGEEIEFEFVSTLTGGKGCHFSGSFTADDKISGTMEIVAAYPPFAWTCAVEGRRLI
jgi:hypothetical protein